MLPHQGKGGGGEHDQDGLVPGARSALVSGGWSNGCMHINRPGPYLQVDEGTGSAVSGWSFQRPSLVPNGWLNHTIAIGSTSCILRPA